MTHEYVGAAVADMPRGIDVMATCHEAAHRLADEARRTSPTVLPDFKWVAFGGPAFETHPGLSGGRAEFEAMLHTARIPEEHHAQHLRHWDEATHPLAIVAVFTDPDDALIGQWTEATIYSPTIRTERADA